MDPALATGASASQASFRDGLGERRRGTDATGAEPVERLCLRADLTKIPSFEFALRERASRLAGFRHPCFARVRSIDRLNDAASTLAVTSDAVRGVRLSTLLSTADRPTIDINAAVHLIRQLVSAIAVLHEQAPDVGHGAIGPERIVITPNARVVVLEYVLGAALEQLRFARDRYWSELRVAVPPSETLPHLDHRADVTQVGATALALILGRTLQDLEYPTLVGDLLDDATAISGRGDEEPLPAGLRTWIGRALQLDPRGTFDSALDARDDLERVLEEEEEMPAMMQVPQMHHAPQHHQVPQVPEVPRVHQAPPVQQVYQAPPVMQVPEPPPAPQVLQPPPVASVLKAPAEPPAPVHSVLKAPESVIKPPPAPRAVTPEPMYVPEPPRFVEPPRAAEPPPPPAPPKAVAAPVPALRRLPDPPRAIDEPVAVRQEFSFSSHESVDEPEIAVGRKSIVPKLAIAAAAIVVLLGGGYAATKFFAPRAAAVTTGTVSLTTEPSGAQVLVDGQTHGVTPVTLSLAPGPHTVELRGPGEPRTIPITVAAGQQLAQYVELGKAVATLGKLQVRTEPVGAQVLLDGNDRGKAPLLIDALAPGEHIIVLQSDVATVKQTVTIEAGQTASLVVPLTAAEGAPVSGWVSVTAPVELQLYEKQKLLGTTQQDRIMVSAGKHDLDLVNEPLGYHVTRTVQVPPGKVAPITVAWPTGTLAINALPWADVTVDGNAVGQTPIGNLTLPIGPHEIVFRHPDLGEQRQAVTVSLKMPARVSVDMRKKP